MKQLASMRRIAKPEAVQDVAYRCRWMEDTPTTAARALDEIEIRI